MHMDSAVAPLKRQYGFRYSSSCSPAAPYSGRTTAITHPSPGYMAQVREKFATHVDATILRKVRKLAEQEWRQLQVLVEEALTDLLEKRMGGKPRASVMN